MKELPLWPPIAAVVFGVVGYVILWFMSRRLDREEEEARRKQHPAE
jgi:hypothetical protein